MLSATKGSAPTTWSAWTSAKLSVKVLVASTAGARRRMVTSAVAPAAATTGATADDDTQAPSTKNGDARPRGAAVTSWTPSCHDAVPAFTIPMVTVASEPDAISIGSGAGRTEASQVRSGAAGWYAVAPG
jgi:hypothetical protein